MMSISGLQPIPVLVYHDVVNGFSPNPGDVSLRAFRNQIVALKQERVRSVSLADYLIAGGMQSSEGRDILITFDDGYAGLLETAIPVLLEADFTALFFIISDFVGKTNRWDHGSLGPAKHHFNHQQLRELCRNGFHLAPHGHTHRSFNTLNDNEVCEEVRQSQSFVSQFESGSESVLAFPFGHFRERHGRLLKGCNIQCTFGMSGGAGFPWSVKRLPLYRWNRKPFSYAQISRRYRKGTILNHLVGKLNYGTVFIQLLRKKLVMS